jgi:hypothetical protein
MARTKRWVKEVKTASTYPPKDLFFFINRGGKGLTAPRCQALEKAKEILQSKRRGKKS